MCIINRLIYFKEGFTANLVENQEYLKLKIYVIIIIRFNIL